MGPHYAVSSCCADTAGKLAFMLGDFCTALLAAGVARITRMMIIIRIMMIRMPLTIGIRIIIRIRIIIMIVIIVLIVHIIMIVC